VGARRTIFTAAMILSTVTVLVGGFARSTAGWPGRISPRVLALATFAGRTTDPNLERCLAGTAHLLTPDQACAYGAPTTPTVALWSDSQGAALAPPFGEMLASDGRALRFFGKAGCPPIFDIDVSNPNRADCRAYNDAVRENLVAHPELRTVVLVARFAAYVDGQQFDDSDEGAGAFQLLITDQGRTIPDRAARQHRYVRALETTLRTLSGLGRTVVVVYPIPEAGINVPLTLARIARIGGDPLAVTRPRAQYEARQRWMLPALDSMVQGATVRVVHPEQLLCDSRVCRLSSGGNLLYDETNHLTRAGADFLMPLFTTVVTGEHSQ
jgi:hypothetical protein